MLKIFCEENKYTRKNINRAKEIAVLRARRFCYLIPVNTKQEDNAQGRGFEKLGCAGYHYQ